MLPSRRKTTRTALMLAACFGLAIGWMTGPTQPCSVAAQKGDNDAKEQPPAGLGPAEYQELKTVLDVKNQPWATVPWKYSITEARKLAAASKKPIFMVVNTGNALGCT
jgi:hypothetical protein